MSKDQLTILVVEDEALVAMNLEVILEDLGHVVIGPVMRLDKLSDQIEAGLSVDAAILDVNIAGSPIYPQAKRLAEMGIPIVFATGYGPLGVDEEWQKFPVVQKPYSEDDIASCLATALSEPMPPVPPA